ncbi:MAG: flagellar biosynthesis regulator FlaF [Rhizobiales bacterium]|nr:flagellar biosynthesis regulator FlaF [Hyphomicrobiales bacterium]
MYRMTYEEILDGDSREGRTRERMALDRGIDLMQRAEVEGVRSPEALEAIAYVQKLWGFLIRDLADPGNHLPDALRGDLISIGLWCMTETDRLLAEKVDSFAGLIAVNSSIRDGLK